ncbi:MAG: TIGR02281 family clan AA aspartic protease [Gammaproteobacteria bacterium]|nr:TIGR02281 family clan AA aspartic protease [Gammaproteobacteria bacterium]
MKRVVVLVWLCLAAASAAAVESVSLHALFKDKAIFVIDGARRMLTRGGDASPEGVRLLSTDTAAEQAEIDINGRHEVVKLGMVMGGFSPTTAASVTLWAEPSGHFYADGMINGRPVKMMVDTGATSIAMSGTDAKRLGIDYQRFGSGGYANTAGGVVKTYRLTLESVQVGPITLYNVDAGVVEGNFPREILLGMSFLSRLSMKRDGNQMELTQR